MKSITITENDYVAISAWEDEGGLPIDATYEILPADRTSTRRGTPSTLSENPNQNSKDRVNGELGKILIASDFKSEPMQIFNSIN